MRVKDIIDLAIVGEFQQLDARNDTITMIGYLNLAMLELYKEFNLKSEEVLITLVKDKFIYDLPCDFMYITAAYDFREDGVDSHEHGYQLPVNEEYNEDSIFTINYNQVQIPKIEPGKKISIIYATVPEFFTPDNLLDNITIPNALIEALLAYMGYKGHSSIYAGGDDFSAVFYRRYELSVERARQGDLIVTPSYADATHRLSSRGFM